MAGNDTEYKIYGYRWIVLVVYLLSAMTIQMLWTTFFSITLISVDYYGFTDEVAGESAISLLSIIFMIGMIVLSIPTLAAFEKFGYKKSVGFGVVLMAVASLFRGMFGDNYTAVLACTVLFAVAQPFILNSVGIVPGRWFPAKERATANGLGLMSSYVGMMVGLLVTPILIDSGMSIKTMLTVYGIWSAVVGVLFVVLTREAPPTPPCAQEDSERVSFLAGIKLLIKNSSFILIMLAFFITFGVFNTFFTLIEPILNFFSDGKVGSVQTGIIGVIILTVGILGSVLIPMFSDKSKGHKRKPFIVVCHLLGGIGVALFMFMGDFNGMIIAAVIYGLFSVGSAPVTMTYSAELSYPVSEGTSEGLLMFAGNVAGVVLLGIATLFGGNYTMVMIMLAVLMGVGLILYLSVKDRR